MADFNRKKLQVFVSSTYTDLKSERQAAVEAILTAGHIPAGMELFTAGDESQMEVIKQWIDESDVFLLILGGRYGSLEPKTQKSYTHLEYEYAAEKKKALFACVINDSAIEARVKDSGRAMLETSNPQKLVEFRAQVLKCMCRHWDDQKDIKIAVAEALATISRRDGLIGWIRPSSQSDLPALADEIARLSRENAELRTQLSNHPADPPINGLSFGELVKFIDDHIGSVFFLAVGSQSNANSLLGYLSSTPAETEKLQKLEMLGLAEGNGMGHYKLTPEGKALSQKISLKLFNRRKKLPVSANSTK